MTKIPMLKELAEPKKTTSRFVNYQLLLCNGLWDKVDHVTFEECCHNMREIPMGDGHRYRYFIGWNNGRAMLQRVLVSEPENDV